MNAAGLHAQIASIPPGRWAVGVSGGADSVALLTLLRQREDLILHVAHLDHETRGGESALDAKLVQQLGLSCTVATRSSIESTMHNLPANRSARFRQVRFEFFRLVIAAEKLHGVILAHHADDQAETIFQRLLRGSGIGGLGGMSADHRMGGLRILRPLLSVQRQTLREFLRHEKVTWREDGSNLAQTQQRNRVRVLLQSFPQLNLPLVKLGAEASALIQWLQANSPGLAETFSVRDVSTLSPPIARESARRWLAAHSNGAEITPDAVERLLAMCLDAATPPRQNFPGGIRLRRTRGVISMEPSKERAQ